MSSVSVVTPPGTDDLAEPFALVGAWRVIVGEAPRSFYLYTRMHHCICISPEAWVIVSVMNLAVGSVHQSDDL